MYLNMDLVDIKHQKKHGDIASSAKLLGITRLNASKAFERPGSKYHNAVIAAIEVFIETRKNMALNQ